MYDPEAVLADLSTGPAEPSPVQQRLPGPSPVGQGDDQVNLARQTRQRLIWYERQKRRAISPQISDSHRRYLEEAGAFLRLPQSTTDALLPIYISLLDDPIPLVDASQVYRAYSNGQASHYLILAMCLVTCKANQATPFLHLSHDGPLLSSLDFSSKLMDGLSAAMKADLEPDRIAKIQILALMHLHNDGRGGLDRSSSYLSQAVSEAWALCLHVEFVEKPEPHQTACHYLWWTLRNLDKLNKPLMGASPFLIDDTDIGVKRIMAKEGNYRSQVMDATTTLGDLMKVATKAYKASSTVTEDVDVAFPSLEHISAGTGIDEFHRLHRGKKNSTCQVVSMLTLQPILRFGTMSLPCYHAASAVLVLFTTLDVSHHPTGFLPS